MWQHGCVKPGSLQIGHVIRIAHAYIYENTQKPNVHTKTTRRSWNSNVKTQSDGNQCIAMLPDNMKQFTAIRFSFLLGAKCEPNIQTLHEKRALSRMRFHNNKLVSHSIANTHRPLREARAERAVPPFASKHTYPLGAGDRPAARNVFMSNRSSTIEAGTRFFHTTDFFQKSRILKTMVVH